MAAVAITLPAVTVVVVEAEAHTLMRRLPRVEARGHTLRTVIPRRQARAASREDNEVNGHATKEEKGGYDMMGKYRRERKCSSGWTEALI